MCASITISYIISLYKSMMSGMNDSINVSNAFSNFKGKYKEIKIINQSFMPYIEVNEVSKTD